MKWQITMRWVIEGFLVKLMSLWDDKALSKGLYLRANIRTIVIIWLKEHGFILNSVHILKLKGDPTDLVSSCIVYIYFSFHWRDIPWNWSCSYLALYTYNYHLIERTSHRPHLILHCIHIIIIWLTESSIDLISSDIMVYILLLLD